VQAALKAFPDKGITFLLGDHTPAGTPNNPTLVAVAGGAGEPGDRYSSSALAFQHGFLALKDTLPARGVFRYGAGLGSIKFSSTLAWLKAQLFVGVKAVGQLVGVLQKQLREYTKDVPPSAGPEDAPPVPLLASTASGSAGDPQGVPLVPARSDTSRDGLVTPLDALLIINDLNARGGRQVGLPSLGADEDLPLDALPATEEAAWLLDVNGDGWLGPLDALLVINQLNEWNRGDNTAAASASSEEDSTDDPPSSPVVDPPPPPSPVNDELLGLLASEWPASPQKRT
jgi:hypothetical protein